MTGRVHSELMTQALEAARPAMEQHLRDQIALWKTFASATAGTPDGRTPEERTRDLLVAQVNDLRARLKLALDVLDGLDPHEGCY